MLPHRLKLNDVKTEVIRLISKHNNTKFGSAVSCPFSVGSNNIIPALRVRNLGVIMDQQLYMIDQITVVCASCNYHLRRLSSIRRYLTPEATQCAVQALITSRLDFCNRAGSQVFTRARGDHFFPVQTMGAPQVHARPYFLNILQGCYI